MHSSFLEVNEISLLGENHKDVVNILKELPIKVTMVCCRPVAPSVSHTEVLENLSLSEVQLAEKVFKKRKEKKKKHKKKTVSLKKNMKRSFIRLEILL